MSRIPGDAVPPQPRKPRPTSGSAPRAGSKPAKTEGDHGSESSTFRPNPAPAPPRSGRSQGTRTGTNAGANGGRRQEAVAPGPKWWERILFGRVGSGQLSQFCRQFSSYLNAGVDYNRALPSLERQFHATALGPAIARIHAAIKGGSTLEEAMSRESAIFGPMFLSMIRVAETRGGVPETLKILGNHYEKRQSLIRQARSAMIYPAIVLLVAGGVIALITIVLLPMFASMLNDISRGAQLPFASRALLAFSGFVRLLGWWLFPVIMIGVPLLLIRFYKTSAGKATIDRLILMTPVFGPLFRKLDTSRFARTLASLLDAGVDIKTSIGLTADVVSMAPISRAIRGTSEKVMAGKELSVALADTRQFPPDVVAVLASGEETGKIPESLTHVADDYEEQVAVMVKNLGYLVQPLLTLILGGIVLFIILAVFLPYIQALTSLAQP